MKDAFHGIRADQGDPVVRLGYLVSDTSLAPVWIGFTHLDHLLLNRRFFVIQLMRYMAFEFFQTRIALLIKTSFPLVECPSAHFRLATSLSDTAGSFPGLKQKFTLLRGGVTIVGVFWAHVPMLPHFGVC